MPVRNLAILFALSATLVLHPLLPFIEYYTFKQYIIENLCINRDKPGSCCEGKCYLEKRIKENSEDNPQEKQNSVVGQLKRIESNLPEKLSLHFYTRKTTISPEYLVTFYSCNFYQSIFHPPKS